MVRNVRILLALVAVLAFSAIWELDLQRLAEGLVGGRLAASLFEIVLTLILAYAVWSLVKAGVAHLLGEDHRLLFRRHLEQPDLKELDP